MRLLTFHLEISGNSFNDEHSLNNRNILNTFAVFHLEMSGNSFNDEHL